MEAMAVLERAGPDEQAVLEVDLSYLAQRPRGLSLSQEEELLRLAKDGSSAEQEGARLTLTGDYLVIAFLAAHRFVDLTWLGFRPLYEASQAAFQAELEANQETSALVFADRAVAAIRRAIVNAIFGGSIA